MSSYISDVGVNRWWQIVWRDAHIAPTFVFAGIVRYEEDGHLVLYETIAKKTQGPTKIKLHAAAGAWAAVLPASDADVCNAAKASPTSWHRRPLIVTPA